jgi:hypothetical protein
MKLRCFFTNKWWYIKRFYKFSKWDSSLITGIKLIFALPTLLVVLALFPLWIPIEFVGYCFKNR